MEKKIAGYIYILTNPSFEEYVKIGFAENVEQRVKTLNNSDAVPFGFRIFATYAVPEKLSDKSVHEIIDGLNPSLRSVDKIDGKIRKREFYHISPQKAYGLFNSMATMHGTISKLKRYAPSEEELAEKAKAEENRQKAPNKDFHTMGLKDGDEIFLIKKPELKAVIVGPKAVSFNGSEPDTITGVAKMLFEQYNLGKANLGGFEYFAYDDQDKNLYCRYNRIKGQGK